MRVTVVSLLSVSLLLSLLTCTSMARDPNKGLTQAEAVADVQQFFSTLQRVHPDLLAKVKVGDYIKLKQQTLEGVAEKLDKDGNIRIADLAYLLYYAAAFFQDAHTAVHSNNLAWSTESNTAGKRFPPFLLGYDNGRFVIEASSNKSIAGLEVVSVNGKPVREFLRPILDRISGETLAWKAACFADEQAFWYGFSGLCDSDESLTLVLRNVRGEEIEQKVETVGFADFQKLSSEIHITKLQQLRNQGTQVSFLDLDRIAWFVYPAFKYTEDEKGKVDRIFQQIKAKGCKDLLIDMRGNRGGNSRMGDVIFKYLNEEKVVQSSKCRIKVSSDILGPAYAKALEKSGMGERAAAIRKEYEGLEGMILTYHSDDEEGGEPASKPEAFFSGRVFLLVDNGTFSSGSMFTAAFRDYSLGTILGYETGGVPISFGDMYPFELENSRIFCGVSYKQFFNPKPRAGDDEHGVIPDVPMTEKLLQPYRNEDDPVLAYTLDHIKKTRRSP